MSTCTAFSLSEDGRVLVCNSPATKRGIFPVCAQCERETGSVRPREYATGMLEEWDAHFQLYGTYREGEKRDINPQEQSRGSVRTRTKAVLDSLEASLNVVYVYREEATFQDWKGSAQETPFVRFNRDILHSFLTERLYYKKSEALQPGYAFDYASECEQFARYLCATHARDLRDVHAYGYLSKNRKKYRKVMKDMTTMFKVFWENKEWASKASFVDGSLVLLSFSDDTRKQEVRAALKNTPPSKAVTQPVAEKAPVGEPHTVANEPPPRVAANEPHTVANEPPSRVVEERPREATPVVELEATQVVEDNALEATPVVEDDATPVVEDNATPVVEDDALEATPVIEDDALEPTPVVEDDALEATPVIDDLEDDIVDDLKDGIGDLEDGVGSKLGPQTVDAATQTVAMDAKEFYLYVKEKSLEETTGTLYPGFAWAPNQMKALCDVYPRSNVVVEDFTGRVRSYGIKDLLSLGRATAESAPSPLLPNSSPRSGLAPGGSFGRSTGRARAGSPRRAETR